VSRAPQTDRFFDGVLHEEAPDLGRARCSPQRAECDSATAFDAV
jgi:hypothetical protein